MTEPREARLRELLDKQDCIELVYQLARAIDRCDADLLRTIFHPDATDDHGVFHGTARDFIPWVMDVLATMKRTQHCICNVLIDVQGDKAFGESYFIAHHTIAREGQPDTFMLAAGRYLDRFERRNGEWKISHRQAAYDWNSSTNSTDSWNRTDPGQWTFGTRGQADKSYLNFAGKL
ncbi:MAG TPA: nuclear transport factor 2 family protein [Rhizomicrobium sp.]|nr:nuclear transport factor 2 family protein [Rhizomicrobium sp.]